MKLGKVLFFCLFIAGCVTINIYFPAEKVESAAEKIVEEIRGPEAGATSDDTSLLFDGGGVLAFGPSVVWAGKETQVSNPTIRALKDKLRARFPKLKPFYAKGVLKEGGDGYVAIASTNGLAMKEKRDVKSLVSAENNDRKALYKEVAKALKIESTQVGRVGQIFAKEWQKSVK